MPYPTITKTQLELSIKQGFFLTELGVEISIGSDGFHKNHYINLNEWLEDYNKEKIPCRICNKECHNLGVHLKTHGLNSNEYRVLFNIPTDHSARSKYLDKIATENIIDLHSKGKIPYKTKVGIKHNRKEKAGYRLFEREKLVRTEQISIPSNMYTYRIQSNGNTKFFTKEECVSFLSLLNNKTLSEICSDENYPHENVMRKLILSDVAYVTLFNISNIHRQVFKYIEGHITVPPGLAKYRDIIDNFIFDNMSNYNDTNKIVNGIIRHFYLNGIKKISLSEFKNKTLKNFKD